MNNRKKKELVQIGIGAILLAVLSLAALLMGSVKMNVWDALAGLWGDGTTMESIIMRQIRLPRMLAGLLAGMGLAISGALLQRVTDNGMASPNIIGVNAGAGFAIILLLFFAPNMQGWLPIVAFAGALGTTMLIVWTSNRIGMSKVTVVLAGLAFTTLLNAGISFVSLLDTDVLATYNHFSIGSLAGVNLEDLIVPAVLIGVVAVVVCIYAPQIKILCLGDEMAMSLGVNVKRVRFMCLICASACASAVVSFAGLLGFVGLIVPHIARKLTTGNMRMELIGTAFLGAGLVIVADTLGRTILAPTEIPVGIVLALVGAPFFLILLIRRGEHA